MVDMTQLQAMYGGTFDPVHYGHLKPVEILANQIGLNRVTIVPNNVPPHRPQPEATSDQRRHMLELAIADKPLFILDDRELRRDTPSYSAQTLREWRQEQGPERPLAFIIGQDSLLTFTPAGVIYLAETPWFDISATLIRQRLEAGESCADMMPESVLEYIHQQKLYC